MLIADIEIQNTNSDVYRQGDHEVAGAMTMTVTAHDFTDSTSDQPIFIQIKYMQGAVNGHTLVDLDSDDERLSEPVLPAMWLGTHTGLLAAGERRSLTPDALFDNPGLTHARVRGLLRICRAHLSGPSRRQGGRLGSRGPEGNPFLAHLAEKPIGYP
jgi:hypothetical protein